MDDRRDNQESGPTGRGARYSDAYYREAPQTRRACYGYSPAQCYARASGEPQAVERKKPRGRNAAQITAACLICILLAGILGTGGMYVIFRSGAAGKEEAASERDLHEALTGAAQAEGGRQMTRGNMAAGEEAGPEEFNTLGLRLLEISPGAALYYGLERGVYIYEVKAGSCSEAADLRSGDVITAVGGTVIFTREQLAQELRRFRAGESVSVAVSREREALTVTLVLDGE